MRPAGCWMRRSRFRTVPASWSTVQAARSPAPFFMFGHTPLAWVTSGRQPGVARPRSFVQGRNGDCARPGLHAIVRVTAYVLEAGMGYLIRMAPEGEEWLAPVRGRDPAAPGLVGGAGAPVAAAGEKVGAALEGPAEDPVPS